ncbi:MAG: homoserine dehydrogenase [Arenicellales bacterium]|jgi:homoserine dehydrogenase|nr:homoserine dehydrogenase [Arenicellales bacterium]
MKPVSVGVIGLGTVGAGTVDVLRRNGEEISRRAGREIKVTRAAVRDLARSRDCNTAGISLTANPHEIVEDPGIDVVIELIGGCDVAFDLISAALNHGKHVVTANKALIATRGNEIFHQASLAGLVVAFEAAVAGGIPVIKVLREGLAGNRVERLVGILNGTCNFILSGMQDDHSDYMDVLLKAQANGYAEADPSVDVEGIDAAHKLTILASIAYGVHLDFKSVHVEGICDITQDDIIYARELGYRIKHLGIARRLPNGLDLRVHPCLVTDDHLLSSVSGVMNAIVVNGDAVGETLLYGAGAGARPTASAVIADLVDVVRTLTSDPGNRVPHLAFQPAALAAPGIVPLSEIVCAHYLRLMVHDRPGVLADITRILGNHQVSIEAIRQQGSADVLGNVPVVIVTHRALEANIAMAVSEIETLSTNARAATRIRLETLETFINE